MEFTLRRRVARKEQSIISELINASVPNTWISFPSDDVVRVGMIEVNDTLVLGTMTARIEKKLREGGYM